MRNRCWLCDLMRWSVSMWVTVTSTDPSMGCGFSAAGFGGGGMPGADAGVKRVAASVAVAASSSPGVSQVQGALVHRARRVGVVACGEDA